jgi:hypothetical protein
MTTRINTITSMLDMLSDEQLQMIETQTAYFCRQNLANNIAALPNASLASAGLYINAMTNPLHIMFIPPPMPPPAPVVENAVPVPFHFDLLPPFPQTPLVITENDFAASQHPQLKSPGPKEPCRCPNCDAYPESEYGNDDYLPTCLGCQAGEWRHSAYTRPEGCRTSNSYNFIG